MRAVFCTLLVGVLGLMVASCARSEFDQAEGGGSGLVGRVAFSAAVNPQYNLSYASAETSGVDLDQIAWPTASDFALDILSGSSVVESYAAGAVPSELELVVGAYSVRAHSGVNSESWNRPYLEGVQDFSLSSSSTSFNAKLTCGLQSTLVYLVFDENFSTIFSDYTAYLNTDHTKEAWTWTVGETRVACMRPTEQLLIRVDVTMRSNGSKYNYGINPLVGLKAGELNVVRFSMVGGEVKATITSDNAVNVVEKTVTLQADWLAHRKTSISATFDPTTALEHIYGLPYTTPTDVVVRSNVGLTSLKLKAAGDLATLLGVNEVDLRGANNVEAKTGLVLTKAEGKMAYDGRLNFKGCLNTLPVLSGDASEYIFAVEAVDLLGETNTFEAKINLSLPELGARSVDGSKVWNRYAKVPGVPVIDARVPAEYRETFAFEYAIREGEGDWQSLGRHTGTADIYKGGLKPATTYTTAVDLGGGRYVAEASFTTDVEPQIPNGDFDAPAPIEWSYASRGGRLGADFGGNWATLNELTTINKSNDMYFRSYPCVRKTDGYIGSAALIETVGWGAASTYEHKSGWFGLNGKYQNIKTERATAGKLFLGTYENGTEQHGIAINRLPATLHFRYLYQNIKSTEMIARVEVWSDSELIGQGEYRSDTPAGLSVEQQLPIVYSAKVWQNGVLVKAPTQLRVWFSSKSSEAVVADVQNDNGTATSKNNTISVWDARFYGSKLTVDDVELVYLQDITERYTIQ